MDTADEELDGRLVQALLADPVGDGGQWDMVANLVEKYGLVRLELIHLKAPEYFPYKKLMCRTGTSAPLPRLPQCHELQHNALPHHDKTP